MRVQLRVIPAVRLDDDRMANGSDVSLTCVSLAELRDFEFDDQQEIEVDEGNTAVIECHLPESQPKAQVRYSVKQEWLETSKGTAPALNISL